MSTAIDPTLTIQSAVEQHQDEQAEVMEQPIEAAQVEDQAEDELVAPAPPPSKAPIVSSDEVHATIPQEIPTDDRKDIMDELTFVKERLEVIAKEGRSGADAEKVALQELEKSTLALISSRKQLKEKQGEVSASENTDSAQEEVDQLSKDSKDKESQWSATKEVYHREFGTLVDNTGPSTEVKAKTENDIRMLQDQIASLQKQLDAVSIRRKQMAADAEEQQRRLQEQGALDDDA